MKLLIIGHVGSGKTTLANKISAGCGVPVYDLADIAFEVKEGTRRRRTKREMLKVLAKIDHAGSWIIEGEPHKPYDFLYGWADRILLMEPAVDVRRKRILKRFAHSKFGHGGDVERPTLLSLGKELYKNQRAESKSARRKLAKSLQPYAAKITRVVPKK